MLFVAHGTWPFSQTGIIVAFPKNMDDTIKVHSLLSYSVLPLAC
jgi:hypothetical protein